jgi:hypothetical protein
LKKIGEKEYIKIIINVNRREVFFIMIIKHRFLDLNFFNLVLYLNEINFSTLFKKFIFAISKIVKISKQ